ncbi:hypothetical protein Scep_019175 [Stephania cephalantha]|uniref:Uncharacterized protein n=1 Tax=Stephania cephalantha TaxID=152367 RepID=A0AAP0NPK9_9MAGN
MTSVKSIEKFLQAININNMERHDKHEKYIENAKQALKRMDDERTESIKNLEREISQLAIALNSRKEK